MNVAAARIKHKISNYQSLPMVSCLKLTFNFVTNRNVHSIFTYLPCNLKVILCKTDIYFHLPKQIIIFSDF